MRILSHWIDKFVDATIFAIAKNTAMESIKFTNAHTHQASSRDAVSVVNLFPDEYPYRLIESGLYSIGLHPWHADGETDEELLAKVEQVARNEQVVAIGEVGLDRAKKGIANFQHQIEVFERQIEIAQNAKKPLVIHCVKAYSELISIRKKFPSNEVWVIHGFAANQTIANNLIGLNCVLSFGISVFNRNAKAHSTLPKIDINKILLETDETDFLPYDLYRYVAELLNININELKEIIHSNFEKFFKL